MCARSSVTFDLRQCVSPRVRGNRFNRVIQFALQVYPRVCGGTAGFTDAVLDYGLSPRVRGNRRIHVRPDGSIPACAGEPARRNTKLADPRVYPRVCGGTEYRERIRLPSDGLSPRVRGNPVLEILVAILDGSIPACAGEPTCH